MSAHLDADILVPLEGDEVVDHREIGRRQPLAMDAQPLIDRSQVVEDTKGPLGAAPQMCEHVVHLVPIDPKGRDLIACLLRGDCD